MLKLALLLVEFAVCGFEMQEDGTVLVIEAPNITRTAINPALVAEVVRLKPPDEIAGRAHVECTALLINGTVRYVKGDYETVRRKLGQAE